MNSSSKLYSRREALGAIGLFALACHPLLNATAAPTKRKMALQLYTLRDPAKKDLTDTLKKVRAMGWEYVQWSGMPNLPAEKIRAELDAAGLKAVAAHVGMEPFEKDFDTNAKFWKTVGITDLAPGSDVEHCQTKDGTALEFRLSAAPLHSPEGVVNGLAAMYLDVTEKANLEAQLLRAQRIESIGHLAGGIAHDLNNILSPMMMAAPLLRDEIHTPAGLALLRAVEYSAKRGSEIVKQVLGFARGLKADKVPVQTRHLLRETVEIMQQTFPKSIRVKISFPRDLWLVEGNGTHLHQVLMNLCINARDAMPDGGTLTLLAENLNVDAALAGQIPNAHAGPCVVWTVADTGTGIAQENLGRIFEPFFTTKPVGGGSGLGLHTVATILRNHGGFTQVSSQVGQGTTFKVFLPALPEAQPTETTSTAAIPKSRGECILVVDDEDNIRTLMRALLERHGYRVLLAASGREALAIWPHHPEIRLVIMDLMMTGMSGFQLIQALREISPGVKVVVNTGITDESMLVELLPYQVDAVLLKPAETNHLLTTLDHILAANQPAESCAPAGRGTDQASHVEGTGELE